MKRSLVVASAAALTPVLIAAAPAAPTGSANRAPARQGGWRSTAGGRTAYVCAGSGWQALAHS